MIKTGKRSFFRQVSLNEYWRKFGEPMAAVEPCHFYRIFFITLYQIAFQR